MTIIVPQALDCSVIGEFFAADSLPANPLLGVETLSTEVLLVEIEALAVTDAPMPYPFISLNG